VTPYAADDLHELLPALYRGPDADDALRGLMEVLAAQAEVLDRDIAGLYDNWFIETCAPWVIPYIGDLLRARSLSVGRRLRIDPLSPVPPARVSERGYVANTIGYRRRKGTAAVLERVAFDVTGWRATVVEYFELLSTTQHMNHVRPRNVRTPDVRDTAALALLDGPFDRAAHTAELRPLDLEAAVRDPSSIAGDVASPRTTLDSGRYGIQSIGLFLWRLQDYRVSFASARSADAVSAGYTFNPLGIDAPLFNAPRSEPPFGRDMAPTDDHLAGEPDVPAPLRRRILFDELEARRQAIADVAPSPKPTYFTDPDDREPTIRIWHREAANAPFSEVPPEEILICDLTGWRRAPSTVPYTPSTGGGAIPLAIGVAIDPVLGRLTFPAAITPLEVRVSFTCGAVGDLGGGPYDRRDGVSTWLDPTRVTFQRGVTKDATTKADASDPSLLVDTLQDAIAAWNAHLQTKDKAFGVITVMDSSTYAENLTGSSVIDLPDGCRLAIVAADWPDREDPAAPVGSAPRRVVGELSPDALIRPHVMGAVSVRGTAPANSDQPGELVLDGLLVEGQVTVLLGNLGAMRLIDTTLAPASGGLVVNASANPQNKGQLNDGLSVAIDRSICGPIALAETVPALHVGASVVDARSSSSAIYAPGTTAHIHRSTMFGSVSVQALEAENSIFADFQGSPREVQAARLQEGCVRFCAVPDQSPTRLPRRYRCQPELALVPVTDSTDRDRVRMELTPAFTSTTYGDPGYAQLADTCDERIRTGAEDGSEMGATSSLMQPQREANLKVCLDEHLRFGLEAGIFHVT
jgi:hypothetical protein